MSAHHGHLPGSPARNGLPEPRFYTYGGTGEDVMPLPAEALEPYRVSYEQWLPQFALGSSGPRKHAKGGRG